MKKQFGRWRVLAEGTPRFDKNGQKIRYYICKCECGTAREVRMSTLRRGASQSCGCLRKEVNSKHGEHSSRLYKIHTDMKRRCTNKNTIGFHRYGGRGITYTPEWESYKAFRNWALANGYEDHLTLDRIDNDRNYEPGNCRWVSREVQANNRSDNVRIRWNGKEMNLKEWAKELDIKYSTLYSRIQDHGWSIEDAFTKEAGQYDTSRNASISWSGEEMSLVEWAEKLGMNYGTLYRRIYDHGWSIEDALTKEVRR